MTYTYHFDLFTILVLSDLSGALLIKVGLFDFVLKLSELGTLSTNFVNLSHLLLLVHLHASHFTGQVLLETCHVDLSVGSYGPAIGDSELLALGWIESGLSERHFFFLVKFIYIFKLL